MKHEKDKNPIVVTMVPIVVGRRFPNLDTTKPEATENINDTIMASKLNKVFMIFQIKLQLIQIPLVAL